MSLKINDVYFVWCPLSSLYKPPHVYLLESIIIQKARAKRRAAAEAAAAAAAAARTSSSLRGDSRQGRKAPRTISKLGMKGNRSANQVELPAGFRFHPTDDELVNHYLLKKCGGQSISAPIIAEIDLYKYDPWQLPEMALYGEKEWYFFSPRDRKYPNGSRPNRAAGTGYWKATGADKPIGRPKTLGIKKALVFYAGKAPKGIKTNWIMHEYRLANVDRTAGKKNNLRLDDWVLCRIYNKKGSVEKHFPAERKSIAKYPEMEEQKPNISEMSGYHNGMSQIAAPTMMMSNSNDFLYMDTSDSIPRLNTDSSSSEQVLSPEVTCEKEVQSQPKWNDQLDNAFDFNFNYIDDGFQDYPFASQDQFQLDQLSPLQDMFMYLQKPF